MRKLLVTALLISSTSAFAEYETRPELAWVPEMNAQSSFNVQLGGGMLDSSATGSNGTPVYVLTRANYFIQDGTSLFIELPMAGTWSGATDDFGIGNISIGGNHRFFKGDKVSAAFGFIGTFATAQSGSGVGISTRNFYSFLDDTYTVSPFLNLSTSGDKVYASFDFGLNQLINTNRTPGQDRFDSVLFYDAGLNVAMSTARDFWATLEFGGFTTMTLNPDDTFLYAGPGVRYQDDEKSLGLHLQAPLSGPAKNVIDLMLMTDLRFKF